MRELSMAAPTITVKFMVGVGIQDAAQQAIDAARRLQMYVEFDFNGVACHARPDGSAHKLVQEFQKAISSKEDTLKMAFS